MKSNQKIMDVNTNKMIDEQKNEIKNTKEQAFDWFGGYSLSFLAKNATLQTCKRILKEIIAKNKPEWNPCDIRDYLTPELATQMGIWPLINQLPCPDELNPKADLRYVAWVLYPETQNVSILHFLKEIKGDELETLFFVALFTGMRRGELMGLTWDDVNFEKQQIRVHKQLTQYPGEQQYQFTTTKNGKERVIQAAQLVFDRLMLHKEQQNTLREKNPKGWKNSNLVFTNDCGENMSIRTVEKHFKKHVKAIGRPDVRLHDLRHSYAILSILAGDDIKILQENLGHYSAAFTLDVYGSVIREMQDRSAKNMQKYMENSLFL